LASAKREGVTSHCTVKKPLNGSKDVTGRMIGGIFTADKAGSKDDTCRRNTPCKAPGFVYTVCK
jgi:hypothetical protein